MFKLIIKYVGILKHIPLFPAILDAWMTIWTTTFSPQITKAIDTTESEVSSWPGISIAPHRFGGIQFNCFSREIGHIHGNGILDILFDRKTKYDLIKRE
jgi:hypothetical protein